MTGPCITASTEEKLLAELSRIECELGTAVHFNFVAEGARGTWHCHREWGTGARDGLTFTQVVEEAQRTVDALCELPLDLSGFKPPPYDPTPAELAAQARAEYREAEEAKAKFEREKAEEAAADLAYAEAFKKPDGMTPSDMIAWRQRLALSQAKAAAALGCGRRSLQQWEAGLHRIPRYIALACAAVAHGLRPIG